MPSLSTLTDNFNDNSIGPNWGNTYGGAIETGGRARVPCTTGYAGYQTGYSWTLAGATIYCQIPTVPAAAGAASAYCTLMVNSGTDGTRLGFTYDAVAGQLKCTNEVGYTDASPTVLTYSSTTHKWWRLREDGTNVYWDTSTDGSTWTNRRTFATPAWVTTGIDTCAVDMSAHRDAGTANYAEYDLFNTLSNGAVWTSSAALAAASTLTAAGRLSARGSTALAADSMLQAAARLSVRSAAALSVTSVLVADAASSPIPEVAALSAGDWDLRIEQGATFVQTYTVTDDGFTWDGWSARAQIRTGPADHGQLLLDLTPYLTVVGPTVRLSIPAAQTQTLTRNGFWDLEMVFGSTVVRILQGRAVVSLEVTR
ncbi:hypothetical protein ABZV65_19440 [Streptomyces bauhiniae]|uniref:hypothetical protein n=1 Tax=Streptomyces bauhiniae TaxID=2340725 RepID=UPI0033B82EA7